jgi:general secretion pathway protein K
VSFLSLDTLPGRMGGVALITALLIVALATTAAVTMASRQQLDIRRTANTLETDQVGLYSRGVEGWAMQILRRDREKNEIDHRGEDWAAILPPMPVENGELAGSLEDMQGRFNLNNLLKGDKPDKVAVDRFRRLLKAVELDPDLANAIVDWLDSDINPTFPGGVEDNGYLSIEPPYRSGNTLMVSISELMLVKGFDEESYNRIAPYISALPKLTPININTAEVPVLMTLADEISKEAAEQLEAARGDEGFKSVADLLGNAVFAGLEVPEEGLEIGSNYFMLTSDVRFGRVQQRYYTLLHRENSGQTEVIMRAQGVR